MPKSVALVFKLERPARKGGCDRYETSISGEDKTFVIYIPQTFSRTAGTPALHIKVTIDKG